jgi:imipenem/basic amino acid-specific outer membrane pore
LFKLNNTIWSLSAAYTVGADTFLIVRQAVNRTGGYTYGVDGNSTVFVTNSVLHSDLNYADEKSWQARYDFNMAPSSAPGLIFMSRYVKGTDFNTASIKNGA